MPRTSEHRRGSIAVLLIGLLWAAQPLVWPHSATAAVGEKAKAAKLFGTDAALTMTLTGPWHDFARNKNAKKPYPGTLEYVDEAGAKHSVAVAFEPRGNNRLKVCQFPPVKLIFDKQAAENTPFHGNKSLKLVTHCGNGEKWEQYAPKEMLAYHIYNLVTERSYRVRPSSVTYVDSVEHSSDGPHVGFLIEDDSDVAKRNDLQKIKAPKIKLEQLEPMEASRFSLFEFLIGNTDFAQLNGPTPERCCHNADLMAANPQSKVYTVPYDFDSSGLVDAHYAEPNAVLHITSNRQRVFRGFCAYNSTLEAARRELLKLESQILELARNDPRLNAASRQWTTDYLSKGFEVLRDDAKFAGDVTEKCRK